MNSTIIERLCNFWARIRVDFEIWRRTRKLCTDKLCGCCAGYTASTYWSTSKARCGILLKDYTIAPLVKDKTGWQTIDERDSLMVGMDDKGCTWWTPILKSEYRRRLKNWKDANKRHPTRLGDNAVI